MSAFGGMHAVTGSSFIAAIALFLVTIAETSRIPVDNQETHLELTMVHEAMVLEYSGGRLALIEMASYIKQMIFFFLIAQIIFPICLPVFGNLTQVIFWALWYLVRIILICHDGGPGRSFCGQDEIVPGSGFSGVCFCFRGHCLYMRDCRSLICRE